MINIPRYLLMPTMCKTFCASQFGRYRDEKEITMSKNQKYNGQNIHKKKEQNKTRETQHQLYFDYDELSIADTISFAYTQMLSRSYISYQNVAGQDSDPAIFYVQRKGCN